MMEIKKREINRYIKERKDSKGRLLCLIPTCNKLRQKYKTSNRTRNYCSNHTFWDMREFTNWPALREKVLNRDNYNCVKCGDEREEVEVTIIRRWAVNMREMIQGKEEKFRYEKKEFKEIRNNLIADHIIPIALGGDEWDMENIQTLCIKCNKKKTKKDIAKIAKVRRLNKDQKLLK